MILYTEDKLTKYLENDWILREMESCITEEENNIRTNQWLMDIEAKRMIYSEIYGDLLKCNNPGRRVLDVGGGGKYPY